MQQPMRYRKRPVEIEAMRMPTDPDPADAMDVYQWVHSHIGSVAPDIETDDDGNPIIIPGITIDPADGLMAIRTLEGDMKVALGDWVIRGVAGEFYPCKPAIFDQTYERAEGPGHRLHREVTIRPAYDCREVQPCAFGGERCAAGEAGANHGRGEATIHFALYDQLREVRIVMGTGWHHPATPASVVATVEDLTGSRPHWPELGLHSAEPFAGALGPADARGQCPRGWTECYSATFGGGNDDALAALVTGGTDGVWAWLETEWSRHFGAAAEAVTGA